MPSLSAFDSASTALGVAFLLAMLGVAAVTKNRLVARKLRLSVYLAGAFLLLRVLLLRATLEPALASQIQDIHYLLILLAGINAVIVLGLNPLRDDRVPDRFPAIVQDAAVIGVFLVVATLLFPEKLLATSAVAAVVIGFALQDTLGNAFAGLAIQIEKPFRVGHWISVGSFAGRVSEITWRATRLRTKTGNFVVVPNSVMSKEAITNYSEPASPTRLQIEVGVSYDAAPSRVKGVMLDAMRQSPLVLASPEPDVLLLDFAASAITYRARFWVNDFRLDDEASDQVRTAVYYAFRRTGLEIPYPIQIEYSRDEARADTEAADARRAGALAGVPMLAGLTAPERAMLGAAAREQVFGAGERIVHEGSAGESMFVLLDGIARVSVAPDTEVAIIERGGCFGEMSLLTGDRRTASVSARTDCTVLEISPDAFHRIAELNPSALAGITSLAAERRGPLEQTRLAALAASGSPLDTGLLARMRRWLKTQA
ncbi:MAG: mechanosensitive ion channel family protein [Acidobacteriota bacterium]|nr:mechanosensitive ion channel family protein [Acidobacteriota bacterium]